MGLFEIKAEDPLVRQKRQQWQNASVNRICDKCGTSNWAVYTMKPTSKKPRYPACKTCKAREQARNRARANASNAAYRARKKNQTCPTADRTVMAQYYWRARYLTWTTGVRHVVDHIKSLASGGLHHEDNLQVIDYASNSAKREYDRFDIVGEKFVNGKWTKDWILV